MSKQFERLRLTEETDSDSEKEQDNGPEEEPDDEGDVSKGDISKDEDVENQDDDIKWKFLEHKGPAFAPPYEPLPSNVLFFYNGKEVRLSQNAEEVAGFYARLLDHEYTTKSTFNNNFFADWRDVMTFEEKQLITDLSKCDFKIIQSYYQEKDKNLTKEEKNKIRAQNNDILKVYGYCTIDGYKEKLCKFKIEPPGLFRSRGENENMGRLKKRVMPEDVIINCSEDSAIPTPPTGHKWKDVKHDNTVTWLSSWVSNVLQKNKYVLLDPRSKLKGKDDRKKYETARELHKCIDKIRETYQRDWTSSDIAIRQRAVALYFIDRLALRVGGNEADAVGCCSLRVEHIKLHEEKDGKKYVVVFDFHGKDNVKYYNEVQVEKCVFEILESFTKNKTEGLELFNKLDSQTLNKYLKELMPGLSAKVFRTYNASITLERQLDELTDKDATVEEKVDAYNRANVKVAELCNHQWSDSKAKQQQNEPKTTRPAPAVSKSYYNDPRITVAWCKKYDVPIEKIFSKYLREKFQWAIDMGKLDYFLFKF